MIIPHERSKWFRLKNSPDRSFSPPLLSSFIFLENNMITHADLEMNKHDSENLIYFFPIVFSQYQSPQWQYVGLSGNVTDLVLLEPDRIYASVYGTGLFESSDGGDSWTQQPVHSRVLDIAVHPITDTVMFVATWSSYGLFWTDNGGSSWQPISGWPYLPPNHYSIAIHPLSPHIMFTGTGNWEPHGGEIFKSTDRGETWYPVSPPFTNALSFAFYLATPSTIYAGTRFGGVWRSIDNGDSWAETNNGLPSGAVDGAYNITSLVFHPEQSQRLYAATSIGLYVTDDGAENWYPLWPGVVAKSLLFHPEQTETMYLGTTSGIFVSHSAGAYWLPVSHCGKGISANRIAFNYSDYNKLWVATNNGIWQCILRY